MNNREQMNHREFDIFQNLKEKVDYVLLNQQSNLKLKIIFDNKKLFEKEVRVYDSDSASENFRREIHSNYPLILTDSSCFDLFILENPNLIAVKLHSKLQYFYFLYKYFESTTTGIYDEKSMITHLFPIEDEINSREFVESLCTKVILSFKTYEESKLHYTFIECMRHLGRNGHPIFNTYFRFISDTYRQCDLNHYEKQLCLKRLLDSIQIFSNFENLRQQVRHMRQIWRNPTG